MKKVVCPYCGSTHWSVYDGDFDDQIMEFKNFAICADCKKEFSMIYRLDRIKKEEEKNA